MAIATIVELMGLSPTRERKRSACGTSVMPPAMAETATGTIEVQPQIDITLALKDFAGLSAAQSASLGRIGSALECAAYGRDLVALVSRDDFETARRFFTYLDGAFELAAISTPDNKADQGTLGGYLSYQDRMML